MKYVFVLFFVGIGGQVLAQVKTTRTAHDPDDSIVVEKSRTPLPEGGAAWRWQPVDAEFGPLPSSVHVYRAQDSIGGRPQVAYCVSVLLKDRSIAFTAQVGYGQRYTPAQYYLQEHQPLVVINTSFFSFKTNGNLNLVVRDGKILAGNQPSRKGKGDSVFHYTTRSALGISRSRKADVAWIFTDTTQRWPFAFEDAPAMAVGADSTPSLEALHNTHWRRWKMQTAVGGGPVLVHDGQIRVTNEEEGLFIHGEKDMHPRSAIGYTRDGRIIVLAVQGRTPGVAAGVTLAQEAKILRDLGCYEALNLDGGGSSCMLVNGKETIRPSDKEGERPVPAVFLIEAAR
ncbi:MAG TPA: phosphodiester glycosidase family protein [Puia sp.]|jgi:exopolysaccharide biosynthesis protein|nr:phosphodiester glycosidase family protein [Puia sp.]